MRNPLFTIGLVVVTTFSLMGCRASSSFPDAENIESSREADLAEQALYLFFESLHNGNYAQAVEFYGGSYEVLQDYNPEVDPNNQEQLFWNACHFNGFYCLRSKSIQLMEQAVEDEYTFAVEFLSEDGSTFSIGSCCGEESSQPAKTTFHYRVKRMPGGKYKVIDLPVYVP